MSVGEYTIWHYVAIGALVTATAAGVAAAVYVALTENKQQRHYGGL